MVYRSWARTILERDELTPLATLLREVIGITGQRVKPHISQIKEFKVKRWDSLQHVDTKSIKPISVDEIELPIINVGSCSLCMYLIRPHQMSLIKTVSFSWIFCRYTWRHSVGDCNVVWQHVLFKIWAYRKKCKIFENITAFFTTSGFLAIFHQ